jgi:hypothetical protein
MRRSKRAEFWSAIETLTQNLVHWRTVIISRSCFLIFRNKQPVPSLNPDGGRFGLPADFLIAPDAACWPGSTALMPMIGGRSTRSSPLFETGRAT